ncbi:MAG: ABC transporter substrate-binding protein [Bacteroidota bacterium]
MKKWQYQWSWACWALAGWIALLPVLAVGQGMERLVIGESSDVDKLNPLTNFSATGSYLNEYLFYSLLRVEKSSGKFVPLLAYELPKVSADGLAYTYKIDASARFNSGKKLTAEDVVFSLKLVKNPYVNNSQKRSHYAVIQAAEARSDYEVQIRLKQASAQGLRVTGDFAVLSRNYFDPENQMAEIAFADLADPSQIAAEKLAVLKLIAERVNGFGISGESFNNDATCSPYLLSAWRRGKNIELTSNKKFWGRKAGADHMFFQQNPAAIEFRILRDEARVRSSIFQGSVDVYTSVQPNLYFELSDIPKLRDMYVFHSPPQYSYEYIGMNIRGEERGRSPVLADLEVRRALARLVQVDLLLDKVRFGLGTRIAAEYPAYRPEFRNRDLALIPYAPEEAKSILSAAGWKDSDGNGFLDKTLSGARVECVMEIIYNENKPSRKLIAEHLAAQARQAGILISVTELPWKDYLERLKKGDFDLVVGAWVSDPNEDSYAQIWHRKNFGSGSNFIGFGDEQSDALIEAYDNTTDPDNRKSISYQIQKKIYEAQPYIFLWANENCMIVKKEFAQAPIYNFRPGFWLGEW